MNSRKRNFTALAVLVLSLVLLAGSAFSVFAAGEMTEEMKAAYQENVDSFLSEVFAYDDTVLDQMRENGGFYEVMVDAIRNDRDTLGAFIEAEPAVLDDSGEQMTATSNVKFENYDAEVVMYFDYDSDARSYAPKNFVMNIDYPLSTRMAQAGQNTVTGLLVVFVVLFFLAFVISLFKYINPEARGKKKAEEDAPAAAPGKELRPGVPAAARAAVRPAADEDEIAVVIAAAIAAAEADHPSATGYYVRSVKRRASGRNWKRA
ncbi:MAG: OadG family protein [Eubacterium sp.]|nr:OadG family protein [Eubacterium sp.]